MNEFVNKVWQKAIQEDLKKSFAFIEAQTERLERQEKEEIRKRAEQIGIELMEKDLKEIAEIMATLERKAQKKEAIIEIQKERLNSLDKIKDIIIKEYGLEE